MFIPYILFSYFLQLLEVPTWKWDSVGMDIVTDFLVSKNCYNANWVVVDRFTKAAVLIRMRDVWDMTKLAEAYVMFVVKVYVILFIIVSDYDPRFLSHFL